MNPVAYAQTGKKSYGNRAGGRDGRDAYSAHENPNAISQGIVTPFTGKTPPHSLDSERALLGSLLMRPEMIHDLAEIVHADSFYADRHRIIFETMIELAGKGLPVDIVSLSTRLAETGLSERTGGAQLLAELAASVPSSTHAEHYGHTVRNKHQLRRLIQAADTIARMGYDEAAEIEELFDKAEKTLYDVSQTGSTRKVVELGSTLAEAWEHLDRLHKTKDEMRGIPTGFRELDNKLAGFQKSDLIILAARPSMGKTSLALDIARKTALDHKTAVGIFSLEMSAQQLVQRMLAAESNVDSWKIRTGQNLNVDEDFTRIGDAMSRLSSAPIYIDDQPASNILKMRSVGRRLKREKNLGLIIVDYLQLMVPVASRSSDNIVQQVTEISRSLKQLARELDVPVLALSQLSRAVEQRGGEPRLSDLRDSGSIEQDADVVMFIHREDKINKDSGRPNIAKIMIEKHRNGPTGIAELYFDDKHTSFRSIEKSEFGSFAEGL